MARRVCVALVCLLMAGCALAFPLASELDGDSVQVESMVHEVRVGSPSLLDLDVAATNHGSKYDHGGDSNDDVGYLRTHSSKGNDGYQHFDSFHKKDGDKYGLETHSAYGKAEDAGDYGGSHHEKGSYSEDDSGSEGDDGYGAGTTVREHYRQADDEDKSEDFDDLRAKKSKSRQGAGTTVKEHYTQAGADGNADNEQEGTGEYSDDGGHYSGESGGEFYGGGGGGGHSSGEGSYHGGGGGSYHGGGGSGGGGSYHGGGASHSEGGGAGGGDGDKSYYTEYSKGDKDNGSHGSSYGDSSSYGDDYHH